MPDRTITHPGVEHIPRLVANGTEEILQFESSVQFMDCVRGYRMYDSSEMSDWTGDSRTEAMRYAVDGDTRLVPEAERLISHLTVQLPDRAPIWDADIAGEMVVVPEFLSGIHEHMRRKAQADSTAVPIRVFFDTMSSGGIGYEDLKKRGTVVLALLMQLIQMRPVEFLIGSGYVLNGRNCGLIVRVPTAPLNLSAAAFLLTNVAFTRDFMYGMAHTIGNWAGGWPYYVYTNRYNGTRDSTFAESHRIAEEMRRFFRLATHDVIIPPAILIKNEEMWTAPLGWINRKLKECREYEPV
jgi:hypothetical protein